MPTISKFLFSTEILYTMDAAMEQSSSNQLQTFTSLQMAPHKTQKRDYAMQILRCFKLALLQRQSITAFFIYARRRRKCFVYMSVCANNLIQHAEKIRVISYKS